MAQHVNGRVKAGVLERDAAPRRSPPLNLHSQMASYRRRTRSLPGDLDRRPPLMAIEAPDIPARPRYAPEPVLDEAG